MDETLALLSEWAHYFLMWVGFGTLVGLIAKALLPGKDPGGAFATVFIGIVGTVIGAATFYFFSGLRVAPISLMGFVAALAGTSLILISYRLLHGRGRFGNAVLLSWRRTPVRRRATVLDE